MMATKPGMTPALDGRVALVTGAGRGIGKGIALELARAGCRVAVNYVTEPERAHETIGEIRQLGVDALDVKADVSRASDVSAMIDRVVRDFGGLDVLVNNAGTQTWKPLLDVTETEWDLVV